MLYTLRTLRSSLAMSLGIPYWPDFKRSEMTTFGMASVNDLESWVKKITKHFHDHDLNLKCMTGKVFFINYTVMCQYHCLISITELPW